MTIDFKLDRWLPQTIRIEVSGPDVAKVEDVRAGVRAPNGDGMPDVVERWVRAINVGLLGGSSAAPAQCKAELSTVRRSEDQLQQVWEVQVTLVDWGAFRVLKNLLLARNFERGSVRTVGSSNVRPEPLKLATLSFPVVSERLPFGMQQPGEDDVFERTAVLCFAGASEATIDQAIETLDLWAELLMMGAYAPAKLDPKRSGSIPTGAILYDASSVAQSFEGPFLVDPAAFDAVVSYALALSARGAPVASVEFR